MATFREFSTEPLAKHIEILVSPPRGQGIWVMEVESFDRLDPQGSARPLAILAGNRAGSYQGV